MCAIFGSPDFNDFKYLYEANISRGCAAFGMIHMNTLKQPSTVTGLKIEGKVDFSKEINYSDHTFMVRKTSQQHSFYVGHTQAPTSAAQIFKPKTSHPFMWKNWVVAHNGVLTDYETLLDKLDPQSYNIVDSSVIPALLDYYNTTSKEGEADIILKVLGMLKGTYSLWIYNILSGNFYISRCGSTLFRDENGLKFSTLQQPGMVEVEDGSLYLKGDNEFIKTGSFKSNSPFFIL